jgi:Uma2 family endonuclease
MHMASTPTLISLETYLHTSYSPDCDFVNGELEERHVGEYPHSKLQSRIVAWFIRYEREWNIDPLTEQRIRVSLTSFRVCDVCLLRADAPREAVTVTPPLLCIEIMSPEDRLARAKVVLEDYRAMGVAHIWLVDPMRRAAYTYDANGLHVTGTERMEIPESPIYLPLDELFSTLD